MHFLKTITLNTNKMKNTSSKYLITLIAFLFVSISNAQEPYFCIEKGAKLEYTTTCPKGKVEGYQVMEILDVQKEIKNSDTLGTITYSSNVLDKDRKSVIAIEEPIEMTTYFDNEGLKTDMAESFKAMFTAVLDQIVEEEDEEGEEIDKAEMDEMFEITGDPALLPNNMKTGDKLPDSYVTIKVMIMSIKVSVTEREVLREETLTTDVGVFPCIVVTEKMAVKGMMLNEKSTSISWYSRGIGVIKRENYNKKGKLETIEVLSSKNI